MRQRFFQSFKRIDRGRGAARREHTEQKVQYRRLGCEALEDRRMLSIDSPTIEFSATVGPSEVWVDDDWGGSNQGDTVDGHTFGTDAFATVQEGIDSVSGSTVHVAPGTYVENVVLRDGVNVLGAGATTTIIQSAGAGSTVYGGGVSGSIQGLTLTGSTGYGLALWLGCTVTVSDNVITGNYRGIGLSGGSNHIFNNLVINNAHWGIADGSGSHIVNSNNIVSNATGYYEGTGAYPTLTNNIIVDNSSVGISNTYGGASVLSHNDVWNNGTNYVGEFLGSGNICADPLFQIGPLGSYYLSPSSPCVDAGSGPASDFPLGTTRVDGLPDTGIVDMGYHAKISDGTNDPDIIAMDLQWDADDEAVEFEYEVTGLPQATTGVLYWSTNNIFGAASDTLAMAQPFTIDPQPNTYSVAISVADLQAPGLDAEYILFVADPDGTIDESDEQNNVLALRIPDTDDDSLYDPWEVLGLDADGDGIADLTLPDANPLHKNLYVEVDAMVDRAPSMSTVNRVVDAFANSSVSNLDGTTGVTLHIELDDTNIPRGRWATSPWSDFDDTKDDYFGTSTQRNNPNWEDIETAKKMIYRYCIFAESQGTGTTSGRAEIGGNDFMVTLGRWSTPGGTPDQQAGTFMHELGHTLGLKHGGGDSANYKPNYFSVMNYTWQYPKSNYWQHWKLDYSRMEYNDLNEWSLDENEGIGGRTDAVVPIDKARESPRLVPEGGPVDWNGDGDTEDTDVERNVNWFDSGQQLLSDFLWQNLKAHDDWPNLDYDFRDDNDYADGAHDDSEHPEQEMTYEDHRMLERIPTESNSAPIANDDLNIDTKEATPVVIEVLGNDVDEIGTLEVTTVEVITAPSNGVAIVNPDGTIVYTPNEGFIGVDTFTYEVKDDEGVRSNEGLASVTVAGVCLQDDPLYPGEKMLVIGGTESDDVIVLNPGGSVRVLLNGVSLGRFNPTSRIVALGQGGNDNIQVAGRIKLAAWLYGNDGNDRLHGGARHDLLFGGSGDDYLLGGRGHDLMEGGDGADHLVGNAGDDILIAGYLELAGGDDVLRDIMEDWTSGEDFDTRVGILSAILIQDDTVKDDDDSDKLTGSAGTDWFFYQVGMDEVTCSRRGPPRRTRRPWSTCTRTGHEVVREIWGSRVSHERLCDVWSGFRRI